MPELVASLCTLLVLAPLALMPGMGEFLFRPMAMAVAFAMISAYILSRIVRPGPQRRLAQGARVLARRGAWRRRGTGSDPPCPRAASGPPRPGLRPLGSA